MRKPEDTRLHFVGIGGIGMSGIAEVFHNQGYRVSGSDVAESETVRRLRDIGIRVEIGHRPENVSGANVVVTSSAIRKDNPEVREARRARIPVIPRAEMLGELMRGKTGIAVAGTHGKTTTTSMMAAVLQEAGLDPTIVIGGKVNALGGNARLGRGKFVLAEADESDGSFLHLPATYAVVTNVDDDHLDHFGTLESVDSAFVDFVGKLPFYGVAAVCGEDPGVRRCLERFTKPVVTYGTREEFDFSARGVDLRADGSSFDVIHRNPARGPVLLGKVTLRVPGRHNVLNALAAAAVSTHLEIPFDSIARGLESFAGVRRRFEVLWRDEASKRAVIDDYGHHPTEIRATLEAARRYWSGRIVALFQPHRYSRTLHCADGFLGAFGPADRVLLTDIYAAGEEPIDGVSAKALAERIRGAGKDARYVGGLEEAESAARAEIGNGDLLICLGAGSITRIAHRLAESLGSGPGRP